MEVFSPTPTVHLVVTLLRPPPAFGMPLLAASYDLRWEIESDYKSIKRFMAATTSKNFLLRFFYFAFACLLYSIWRAVDLLVQI
jgi:IS4 transposase